MTYGIRRSITRIDTYLFTVHSNIVIPSTPKDVPKGLFPVYLPVKILKALLPSSILATCPAHLNLLENIIIKINQMKSTILRRTGNEARLEYGRSTFRILTGKRRPINVKKFMVASQISVQDRKEGARKPWCT